MLSFEQLPDVLTPKDLIEFLPLGRNGVYNALDRRIIPSVRIGQKYLITKVALGEFLGLPTKSASAGTPTEENTVWVT